LCGSWQNPHTTFVCVKISCVNFPSFCEDGSKAETLRSGHPLPSFPDRHTPTQALVMFRESEFATVRIECTYCTYIHTYVHIINTYVCTTYVRARAHTRPPRRLCCRPAVFFRHLHLALSVLQGKKSARVSRMLLLFTF